MFVAYSIHDGKGQLFRVAKGVPICQGPLDQSQLAHGTPTIVTFHEVVCHCADNNAIEFTVEKSRHKFWITSHECPLSLTANPRLLPIFIIGIHFPELVVQALLSPLFFLWLQVTLHLLDNLLAGAINTGTHRSDGTAQGLGNFLVGVTIDIAHDDH